MYVHFIYKYTSYFLAITDVRTVNSSGPGTADNAHRWNKIMNHLRCFFYCLLRVLYLKFYLSRVFLKVLTSFLLKIVSSEAPS